MDNYSNLLTSPQFLSKEQMAAYQKDTCIFCKERFQTRTNTQKITEECGSHGETFERDVTLVTSIVTNLEICLFDFNFENTIELNTRMNDTATRLKKEKQEHAKKLQSLLETQIILPELEKKQIIKASIQDYLSEFEFSSSMGSRYNNKFEQRMAKLRHNIIVGDLNMIPSWNPWEPNSRNRYIPSGLKTHVDCFPFSDLKSKLSVTTELTSLTKKYNVLYTGLKNNFDFKEHLCGIQDGLDVFEWAQNQPITINIKKYNPTNYI